MLDDDLDMTRHQRILDLLDCISAQIPNLSREQIDDLLYDEHGLPRAGEPLSPETSAERAARHAAIQRTLETLHAAVTEEDRAFDDDAWLYDEQGRPH